MASPNESPEPSLEGAPGARSGRVAIVGRPNAGKSTLLNRLLGQKLAIATHRPGTTRSCILGVYTSDDPPTQIAFIDTPGMHRPKSALGKVLVEQAQLGLAEADVVLFLTEAPNRKSPEGVHPSDVAVLNMIRDAGAPVVLAVNKIDLLKEKDLLLPFLAAYQEAFEFAAVVPISAIKGKHLDPMLAEIRQRLPPGILYEDEDFLTDRPTRFFVAEMVREAVLRHTRQEVPHGCACLIESYLEEERITRIEATIIVEKDSHKGIVIGKGGSLLKKIGTEARLEIERFLDAKVFLKLWVKVIPGWTADPMQARRLATEVDPS